MMRCLLILTLSLLAGLQAGTASALPFAYIPNEGSGTVSVIDTATNTVVATVVVGSGPDGVAVNPAGTRAYVTNAGGGNMSVIDTATNTVVATVPVGLNPIGVAVNPAGTRVYVANEGSNNVSVIDTATNTVVATVPVGSDPDAVAVNPAGTKVYVTNAGSDTLSIIDAASNTVVAVVDVGIEPLGVAVNATGTRVYVANTGSNTVSVIDTNKNNAVVATVPVGTTPIALGLFVQSTGTPPNTELGFLVALNDRTFGVGQTLTASVGVVNPGITGTVADFYVGAFLPRVQAIVFFTPTGSVVGNPTDLTSFRPYATGVSLATPFDVTLPNFFSHTVTSTDHHGDHLFFVLAVKSGPLAPGNVLGLATAPFSFR